MAMVMENAGGMAITGNGSRMLEVVPEKIHDRSGIYMGSKGEIEKVLKVFKETGATN
jgi:fructose-1,6-bisphosphatase I